MAKLFPPYIEGVLPAFYKNNKGAVVLTVPFTMNRGVSPLQIREFALKIKTVQSNTYFSTIMSSAYDADYTQVNFVLEPSLVNQLKIGQYYKVQLAYVDETQEIGQYSTVGIIKYTTCPTVEISGLQKNVKNYHSHEYIGVCKQDKENGDITERIYSYEFNFYDKDKNIISTTGELLHNSSNDVDISETYDRFSIPFDINSEENYFISYSITTQNGIKVSTPLYIVIKGNSINSELNASLEASLNFENGYISLNLIGAKDNYGHEETVTGLFLISRTNEDTNFSIWEDIYRFDLQKEKASGQIWQDFTVEQGKIYQYSIQQYNTSGIYSNRILSNKIYADFEDMFLFDGEKQLKIRFNPKVSSFKTTVLESKLDTIGSKYPFIFRNGRVSYKEFPISGLISRLMDEENLFSNHNNKNNEFRQETNILSTQDQVSIYGYHEVLTLDEIENIDENNYYYYKDSRGDYVKDASGNFQEFSNINWVVSSDTRYSRIKIEQTNRGYIFPSGIKKYHASNNSNIIQNNINLKTDLTNDNINEEREFKLEVLDWLNNGNPKIFRSPTEGNYIVRLMNVTLTPEDRVGRMLHNFSCTAYEVEDFTYSNLIENNFVNSEDLDSDNLDIYFETKQLFGRIKQADGTETYGFIYTVDNDGNSRNINDYPMLSLLITDATPGDQYRIDIGTESTFITIGQTGTYEINNKNIIINGIHPLKNGMFGNITYSYQVKKKTSDFDKISELIVNDFACETFIGECNVNEKLTHLIVPIGDKEKKEFPQKDDDENDILELRPNPKIEITQFYFIQATRREIQRLTIDQLTEENKKQLKKDPNIIYQLSDEVYYDAYNDQTFNNYDPSFLYYSNGYNKEENKPIGSGNKISLKDRTFLNLTIPFSKTLPCITMGNGIIATIGYQTLSKDQKEIEENDENIVDVKKEYIKAIEDLNDFTSFESFKNYYFMTNQEIQNNLEEYNECIEDYQQKVNNIEEKYKQYMGRLIWALELEKEMI